MIAHPYGPGPAAAEARTRALRAAERHNYTAATDQLWTDAWGPPHRDGRGPIAYLFDTIDGSTI